MSEGPIRVSNDSGTGGGAFSELLRLQTEFQARLAEETLHYLRRLQGAAAPAAPGTVVVPQEGAVLSAAGTAGSGVRLRLEIENRQRVHCVVTPMLGPLVNGEGVTWFPAADPSSASSTLLAPGQARTLDVQVALPAELPVGTYRGVLLLQGFRNEDVPVAIEVTTAAPPRTRPAPRQTRTRTPRRR